MVVAGTRRVLLVISAAVLCGAIGAGITSVVWYMKFLETQAGLRACQELSSALLRLPAPDGGYPGPILSNPGIGDYPLPPSSSDPGHQIGPPSHSIP
jgi:hypothetical protein